MDAPTTPALYAEPEGDVIAAIGTFNKVRFVIARAPDRSYVLSVRLGRIIYNVENIPRQPLREWARAVMRTTGDDGL